MPPQALSETAARFAAEGDRASEEPKRTDAELVAGISSGESGATRALYRLVVPVIDRTLLRVLGGRDRDHEDLVQLSLEHLLRSLLDRRFRLDCSLQHWAAALSSRLAISELRRRKRSPSSPVEPEVLDRQRARVEDWERSDRARETRDLMRRALGSIRPERAQVVYLYEVEGFQLAEIAVLMGVSVASAQSRLVRGKKQLADCVRRLTAAEPGRGGKGAEP